MGVNSISRRWIAIACGAVAAGVFAGGVVGAQSVPVDVASSLGDEPLAKVADIPTEEGRGGRGVFVQPTDGFLCLWDAPSASSLTRQGGCNRSDDPLAGKKMMISFAYDGGPAVRDVRDARLIGLVSLDVAAIQVAMSDGSLRAVKLKHAGAISGAKGAFRAFGYRLKPSDYKRGVGPVAVVAFDAAGREIERQPTGFVD
jgi:hypothetical protein